METSPNTSPSLFARLASFVRRYAWGHFINDDRPISARRFRRWNPRAGRFLLFLPFGRDSDATNVPILGWEWSFFHYWQGLGFAFSVSPPYTSDHQLRAHVSFVFGSLYFNTQYVTLWPVPQLQDLAKRSRLGRRHSGYGETLEISVSWYRDCLSWRFWYPTNSSRTDDPRIRHGAVFPLDVLFGKHVYTNIPLGDRVTQMIRLPEDDYLLHVQLERAEWKRVFLPYMWPFVKVVYRADVEAAHGRAIPIPGKGENSWDCGEDATSAWTLPARTVDEAVASIEHDIHATRLRYGGPTWTPAPHPASDAETRA